ncbi:MAG: hypothetical protein KGY61_13555 [Desulfobacterales bacterium]|nr:hypothetical protein [Desulfobacterales bacterium]
MNPNGQKPYTMMGLAGLFLLLFFSIPLAATGAEPKNPKSGYPEEQGMSAEKLVSLDARKASFKVTRGKGEGKVIAMTLEPIDDRQNLYILEFKDLYRLHIFQAPDGAVYVKRLEIFEKNKRIAYRPHLELVPSQIAAEETIRTTGRAKIYNTETGEKANAGTYCYVFKGLTRTTFDTPAGSIRGYLFEYAFRINLGYSEVMIDMENGWSENRKLIYWRTKTTVEKLGMFGETTFRSLAVLND